MLVAILTIQAPLASWSEGGAHYRPTDLIPSWSALTGMVGAAMGWGRDDEQLVQFAGEYAPAIRVLRVGERITDYQTIQSPHRPALRGQEPRTRAEELRAVQRDGTPHNTITHREYLEGVEYEVALVPLSAAPIVSPETLAAAVMAPVFPLYAGRRSCPLVWVPARVDDLEPWLAMATHWDERLPVGRRGSLVRERRDLLVGLRPRRFGLRNEVVE